MIASMIHHTLLPPDFPPADFATDTGRAEDRAEQEWERLSEAAVERLPDGAIPATLDLLHRAEAFSLAFAAGDPRIAAGLSNAAAATALAGNYGRATEAFANVIAAWEKARLWTETMAVSGTARSSLHHHRLELRHRHSFAAHLRRRYRRWLDAGEAASTFNHGIVLCRLGFDADGRKHIATAARLRHHAFGAGDPAYLQMAEALASDGTPAEAVPGRSVLQRWRQNRPPRIDDLRRILAAVCFAVVLDPRHLP